MKSKNLHRARVVKNDEFYTQMCDIEKECSNYLEHFFDKTIYCNCDTSDSNFVKYFKELKRQGKIKDIIYSGGLNGMDFRGRESIELLKKADIVVSNPPFSLFRQYITQLIDHNKKFLVIGNTNAISYKEVFPLIKNNKIWIGTRNFAGGILFNVPDPERLLAKAKQANSYKIIDGDPKAVVPAAWFTNIGDNKRDFLNIFKNYFGNENDYPKYDNCDAININRKTDIPVDYYGIMGVPITFIDKYNPQQFSILGLDKEFTTDGKGCRVAGKSIYTRVFICRKSIANDSKALTAKAA